MALAVAPARRLHWWLNESTRRAPGRRHDRGWGGGAAPLHNGDVQAESGPRWSTVCCGLSEPCSADVVAAVVKRANNLRVDEKHEKDDDNTHNSNQGLRVMNSDGSITLHETATRC